jgi:hypothetical protein
MEGGAVRRVRAQTTKLLKAQTSLMKSLKALGTARRASAPVRRVKRRTSTKKPVRRTARRVVRRVR